MAIFLLAVFGVYQYKSANSYIIDLDFIYKTILENHPGIYNQEDPDFKGILEQKYSIARNKLKGLILGSKKAIIDEFIKSFDDSHLQISWTSSIKSKILKKDLPKVTPSIFSQNDQYLWIKIPSFQFDEKDLIEFDHFLESFSQLVENKKLLIFDLRGNGGGNSLNGRRILSALFGTNYVEGKIGSAKTKMYVDWRASQGNFNYLKELYSNLKELYSTTGIEEDFLKFINGMEQSLQRGEHYYRQFNDYPIKKGSPETLSSNCNIKIVVIIDSKVFSAALDFIDDLKIAHSNVILIGQTTGKDRLYMDVRSVALPSGRGYFIFPMKVYRNRLRKDNEPYVPDIKLPTSDDSALKSFVKQRLF